MRIIFLLIILLWTNLLFGQNIHEQIKGHWGYCDKKNGYTEVMISDTLINSISEKSFFMPFSYEIQQNYTVFNNYKNEKDTLFFHSINKSQITTQWSGKEKDTLNLINKITPFENNKRNCELEMTPMQYSEYILAQYRVRRVKNKLKCIPSSYDRVNTTIYPTNEIDKNTLQEINELIIDSTSVYAHVNELEYTIIKKNIKENKKPELVEYIENSSIDESLIIVDYWGKCYVDYKVNSKIINQKLLNIQVEPYLIDNYCDKNCKIRLYIPISLKNYRISGISINNQIIR